VLGLFSVLAFAPFWLFLWILPPAAIISGLLALRRIADAPEVWAGKKLARAGIGLAVAFGGVALVRDVAHYWNVRTHGRAVAQRFLEKIQAGDMESAFWLKFHKEARREFAEKSLEELPGGVLEQYANFRNEVGQMSEAIARGEVSFEFESVEDTGKDHAMDYAVIVYRVHTPDGDKRVMLETVGLYHAPTNENIWWVRNHQFDYQAGSFKPVQPAGHGHSH
jgi:hypothetical protein